MTTKRTTLRGTALLAMETLAPESTPPAPELATVVEPRPEHLRHYDRQAELFDRTVVGGRGR